MFSKPVASIGVAANLPPTTTISFRDKVLALYPALLDTNDITRDPDVVPTFGDVFTTGILPNRFTVVKFTSYTGESGTLYTDYVTTPLWFKIGDSMGDGLIVPTLYTLWKCPTTFPALTTWGPVVDKLREGADLMIPGVIIDGDTEIPDLPEGALVVIRIRGNKYPLGVGIMATSSQIIAASRGGVPSKGKAVHMLHVYKDHLWAMGKQPDFPADWKEGSEALLDDKYELRGDEFKEFDDTTEVAKILKGVSISDPKDNLPASDDEPLDTGLDTGELTTEEVDHYLQEALLQVLKFEITEREAKELLPLNASTLYSSYILPNRAPGRAAEADIKKSSWKKLTKWLKTAEKQGLIKCKEIKGDLFLQGVTWGHPQLDVFRGHKTVAQQAARQAKVEAQSSQLQVLEAYQPNGPSTGFFEAVGQSKDGYYTLQEVQSLLTKYIEEKQLIDQNQQHMVRLDEVLIEALKKESETEDRVEKSAAHDRLVNNMAPHHFIGHKDQQPLFVKGALKPIKILHDVVPIANHKTKVSGLEHYLIDVDAFAQELKGRCGSRVSIAQVEGASPELKLREIVIQGRQARIVAEVLLEKGVPKKFIEFEDKDAWNDEKFRLY
ncbi:hypothetical protein BGZ99_009238 [Dissophora globulifera]|uniref:Ligatin n=1 Tax=Dissophora globulifera TaxID=979702 RepID=A0A9P6RQQ7_9FUNG|nr:hypothetical protein BGZ99_009238 [Dissophora globulifera]